MPSPDLQKVSFAIDDGFPDVRLTPIEPSSCVNTGVFPENFMAKSFLKYGSPKRSEYVFVRRSAITCQTQGE